jgi:hypothetical protein
MKNFRLNKNLFFKFKFKRRVLSMSYTAERQSSFFISALLNKSANFRKIQKASFAILSLFILTAALSLSASAQTTFESPTFTTGTVHNQNGWSSLGSAGLGCANYDHAITTNNAFAPVSFGAQSLRISNAVTGGCFHDGTFSASLANEAGETSAVNNGMSGGIRQNHFEYQFSIASAVPGAEQPGLYMSVSPDRGDGARMSYLRFEDRPDGLIHIIFDDFIDAAPFGGAVGDTAGGCGAEDDFTDIDIAQINRTAPHTIKFVMDFYDGARNDVVKIYIDGILVKTGTSWEDYFRYCEGQQTRTVDSMLFRTGGNTNFPANAGKGFLIDNPTSVSSSTLIVDDNGAQCPTATFTTIQAAVTAANQGDTIQVCAGTYPEYISTNKNLTFLGPQAGVDARTGRAVPANEAVVGNSNGAFNLQVNPGTTTIDGFTMTGANSGNGDAPALLLLNGSGHQIVNNIFEANQRGAYFVATDTTFKHNRLNNTFDGFFGGGANATIEENKFIGAYPDGAVNTTNSPQSNNYRIINNTFTATGNFAVVFNTNNSQVSGNTVTGTASSAIFIGGGNTNLLVSENSITGNGGSAISLSGGFGYPADSNITIKSNDLINNVRGVNIGSGANSTTGIGIHFNRIVGNSTAGITNTSTSAIDAENNWWGCNYGPAAGGAGCSGTTNGITGTAAVDANPWLTLTTSAAPTTIGNGSTSTITSKLTINSASVDTSASGSVSNTTLASFVGTNGTVAPPTNTTTSGVTTTVFTATSNSPANVATTVNSQTVNASISINTPCVLVSTPSSSTLRNVGFAVPITTGDITGRGVISYDFTLTYNASVLSYTGVSTTSTLSSGAVVTVNNSSPGTLIVSGYDPNGLTGSGTLLNVNFTSTGAIGTSSTIALPAFSYNEDNPCVGTSSGTVTIVSGAISGTVKYLNSAAFRAVENATLSASGAVNVSTNSNVSGTYTLSGLGNSNYTVTPSKSGDIPAGVISGFDASRIAQHVVGIVNPGITPFTPGGGAARSADVSGNGTITSLDAAMIARYAAGFVTNIGNAGTWTLIPTSRSYTLAQVQTGVSGEDYSAILFGDVTGNWKGAENPTRQFEELRPDELIRVIAPNSTVESGAEFVIPIELQNLVRKDVSSYQFELNYNSKVILPGASVCDVSNTVSTGLSITCNTEKRGIISVVVFGANSIKSDGVLLNLKFRAVGSAGSVSNLRFSGLMLNEGEPQTIATDGEVRISASADSDSIDGQLLTADGQGVSNARVILTDSRGETRFVYSNAFGNFRFGNVQPGESYVISVSSKRFVFTPQAVSGTSGSIHLALIAEQ